MKIDVGAGTPDEWIKGNWVRIDPYVKEADTKAFAWKLPYKNCSVDEIWSSHTLEHLPKRKIPITLEEWWRVLKWGGKLTVRVPDLVWCCLWWLDHQTHGWDIDILFGGQTRKGEFHRTGFNDTILSTYLTEVGFTIKKIEELKTHNQKTLSFECIK